LPSEGLFAPILVPDALGEAVSDRAWLEAMLDAERALAAAEAEAGVIPHEAAEAIAACCAVDRFDVGAIGRAGRRVGNPVEPLVRALSAVVGGESGRYVHFGATSQDILDTAAMLVARHAVDLILADVEAVAAGCATLADRHRSTVMPGRTLLQQAVPTTFGLKAAGWLVAVVEARRGLAAVRFTRLAAQLGGAAGTLASLGGRGPTMLRLFAQQLELDEPVLPWHTLRARVAELGAALDVTAGSLAKIGLDVALLAQTEVAEVAEAGAPGRGASSTMPHKRNPVGAVAAGACARQVHAHASVLVAGLAQEHERAIGAWQAEWQPLSDALALTGGAAAWMRDVVSGLRVDRERMRRNLDATDGLIMAERVSLLPATSGRPTRSSSERSTCTGANREDGSMPEPTYEQGLEVRREVLGDEHVDAAIARTTDFTAEYQDLITRYAWGEIWTRPGLDRRTRSCMTLIALVALNRLDELAMHVRAALRNGLTPEEIKEVLLHSAIYCGVPAANSAFAIAQRVLEEGASE
jgi:3-carboxy-cis,cis-muconate cycloisomerase